MITKIIDETPGSGPEDTQSQLDPKISFSTLPDRYTLRDLQACLTNANTSQPPEKISALHRLDACLHDDRKLSLTDDSLSVLPLCERVAKFLNPDPRIFVEEHPEHIEDERLRHMWCDASYLSLCIIARLLALPIKRPEPDTNVLRSLIAFTNPSDGWSSKHGSELAADILADHGKQATSTKFIIQDILHDYIRPLFMKSRPDTVTAQGRKATVKPLVTDRFASHLYDPVKKPWKYMDLGSISIFRWAIVKSDKELMESNWHLFIPPVLTLLDDPSTPIRLSGMACLSDLLDKMPSRILEQTGLGDVMEEALVPTLSFLPTLTPVEESLLLLNAAYGVLLKLTDVRFGDQNMKQKKQKVLDKLLRQGVLYGMDHCQQNGQIVKLLLSVMTKLISQSGIHAVKHMKDITPVVYTLLMDPFAPATATILDEGVNVLQAIVLNCWPILLEDRHRVELLKVMSVCWLNIDVELENDGSAKMMQLQQTRHKLEVAAALLLSSNPDQVALRKEVAQLVDTEPRLAGLFSIPA